MQNNSSVSHTEDVANKALEDTETLHADLKHMLAEEGPHCPSEAQLKQWMDTTLRTNRALSRLVQIAWMADDRHNIEMSILRENVKRDILDREATFAHTWSKLHQQTAGFDRGDTASHVSVERAQAAAFQVESALAAMAPVANTSYHGAAALALLH